MFGRDRLENKLLSAHYAKSWHDDPRIKGAYSSLRVGADLDFSLQALESPEDDDHPQLFFAGDYVSRHPGSTRSAYQSGIDALRRAVALRKKK